MADDIDIYAGSRMRRRRLQLGLTQLALSQKLGIRFQQIHKYECAANRMSATRLFEIAKALDVPTDYFFDGFEERRHAAPAEMAGA